MLRKFIISLVAFASIGAAAIARDGVFPMLSAAGYWKSSDGKIVYIQYDKVPRIKRWVEVWVAVYNRIGEMESLGTTMHHLGSKELVIPVVNADRSHSILVMKAVYDTPQDKTFKLLLSWMPKGVQDPNPDKNIIVDREE